MKLVDVHDLLYRPGVSRKIVVRESLDDLATELAKVPAETPIELDVLLESVAEGIVVSGTLSGTMALRCARCLQDFSGELRVRVRELFAHAPRDDEDHYPITDGEIDLEPCARDALLLSMPFSPLCKPNCLGLCPRCGGERNLGECKCGPETDARWAALSSLQIED